MTTVALPVRKTVSARLLNHGLVSSAIHQQICIRLRKVILHPLQHVCVYSDDLFEFLKVVRCSCFRNAENGNRSPGHLVAAVSL